MKEAVRKQYQQELDKLNEKCIKCQQKYGPQSYDHCNYDCSTGRRIHNIHCMMGEAPHSNWNK